MAPEGLRSRIEHKNELNPLVLEVDKGVLERISAYGRDMKKEAGFLESALQARGWLLAADLKTGFGLYTRHKPIRNLETAADVCQHLPKALEQGGVLRVISADIDAQDEDERGVRIISDTLTKKFQLSMFEGLLSRIFSSSEGDFPKKREEVFNALRSKQEVHLKLSSKT